MLRGLKMLKLLNNNKSCMQTVNRLHLRPHTHTHLVILLHSGSRADMQLQAVAWTPLLHPCTCRSQQAHEPPAATPQAAKGDNITIQEKAVALGGVGQRLGELLRSPHARSFGRGPRTLPEQGVGGDKAVSSADGLSNMLATDIPRRKEALVAASRVLGTHREVSLTPVV